MRLELSKCVVRPWTNDDLASLVEYANNRKIWLNLRDRFPHPYTRRDGRDFIHLARSQRPETMFAIEVGGQAAGGIGYVPHTDVERISAEIGYWLGEPFWGRGIVTEALVAVTKYAFETSHLTRVFALPYARNEASCRVLEKAGYVVEGRLRRSCIKDGEVLDQMQYAIISDP